jgi:hypothetical protein
MLNGLILSFRSWPNSSNIYIYIPICVCEKVGMDGRTPKLNFELSDL